MRINNNLMAMNTHRQLSLNSANGAKSIEKLSSGYRINRAGDDAAGLAISEKMRSQIRGLSQASRNAQDSISLVQTAEGALQETQAILQRMRELAVQSANDTNVEADRTAIQNEVDQLAEEITRIADNTEFNTKNLLNGTFEGTFQIGSNKGQSISLTIGKMDSQALGVGSNELATEEVTVTAANLVTANSILVNDSNTAYTVEKLEAATTVSGVANTQYILRDADNNVVAASADGIAFSFAHTTNTITDDIATTNLGAAVSVSLAGGTTGINKITSGTITVVDGVSGSLDFKALSTVADSNIQLGSGTYTVTTVAASGRTDVNTANQILVNKETNEVVAVGNAAAASTTWKSLDGASTLMTTSGTLALNDTVTVTGSGGIDISSQTSADTAIDTIDTAIKSVSDERAKLGATQNRLEHTIKNLDTSSENLQAAESRIRDVDMAKEMMEFTKNNILQQAAQAMLAQANQAPQGVLQLLR